uniref:Uncharacterized protein n=1 Tax=Anguilla anguilla TaxID=7936 RepID=A0A0E9PAP5_ANGAN
METEWEIMVKPRTKNPICLQGK